MGEATWRRDGFRTFLFAVIGVWVATALACVVTVAIAGFRRSYVEEMLLSGLSIGFFSLVMLACAFVLHRRPSHPLPLAGLAGCAVVIAMILLVIWGNLAWEDADAISRYAVTGAAWSVLIPVLGLLGLARLRGGWIWLRRGTAAAAVGLAMVITGIALFEFHEDESWQLLVGAIALTLCGMLCVLAAHLLTGTRKQDECLTTPLTVSLTCPRCRETQPVVAGRSKCRQCRLVFRFEIEEERCPKCGYLLYKLVSDRCPECGTAIFAPPTSPATATNPTTSS